MGGGAAWGTLLAMIRFLMVLFFLVCEIAFLRFWTESLFSVRVIFLDFFCYCSSYYIARSKRVCIAFVVVLYL